MAINPVDSKSAQAVTPGLQQQQKNAQNVAILEATATTIIAKDEPLALLLRTAIEKLNDELAPDLGPNAIQSAIDSGLDVSPEATAERIVSLSTAFYSAFREQHANETDEEVLAGFLTTISEGIDRGFAEAREILDGLQVLEDDIATNIDRTYELVQQMLGAFEESFSYT